jgi:hypothetical protein
MHQKIIRIQALKKGVGNHILKRGNKFFEQIFKNGKFAI